MKVVFFWYSDHFKKKFWKSKDIIFFDSFGWWLLKDKQRENCSINNHCHQKKFHSNFDILIIIKQLRDLMPVWSRWYGKGDQYELLLREAAFQVGKISASLEHLGPGVAIFHTGVSHWMDVIICELACKVAGWQQVFLYKEVFSSRLIPMDQKGSIKERKPLNYKISSFNFENEINLYLKNLNKGNSPKSNEKMKNIEKSFWFNLSYLLIIPPVKYFLRPVKRLIFQKSYKSTKNEFSFYQKDYFFQNIIQIQQQRKSIKFYKKHSKINKLNYINSSPVKLVMAAHFQPEATSFPEGGDFGNHVDILIKIRQLGYSEILYYKEHPGTELYGWSLGVTKVGMYRSIKYYQKILSLDAVFLNLNQNLFDKDMGLNNLLPVTITGNIAIERSLMGLHTIVVGEPYFKGLPGTLDIRNFKSLSNISSKYVTPDPDIKDKANKFFINLLNKKTLTNVCGIGTGRVLKDKASINCFNNEIELLLKNLKK